MQISYFYGPFSVAMLVYWRVKGYNVGYHGNVNSLTLVGKKSENEDTGCFFIYKEMGDRRVKYHQIAILWYTKIWAIWWYKIV